jgi:hypothetical protein
MSRAKSINGARWSGAPASSPSSLHGRRRSKREQRHTSSDRHGHACSACGRTGACCSRLA